MAQKRGGTFVEGFGFVGRWCDGTLGWVLPSHLNGNGRRCPDRIQGRYSSFSVGERSYLCKITIRQVLDSRGRPIVRRIKS